MSEIFATRNLESIDITNDNITYLHTKAFLDVTGETDKWTKYQKAIVYTLPTTLPVLRVPSLPTGNWHHPHWQPPQSFDGHHPPSDIDSFGV